MSVLHGRSTTPDMKRRWRQKLHAVSPRIKFCAAQTNNGIRASGVCNEHYDNVRINFFFFEKERRIIRENKIADPLFGETVFLFMAERRPLDPVCTSVKSERKFAPWICLVNPKTFVVKNILRPFCHQVALVMRNGRHHVTATRDRKV